MYLTHTHTRTVILQHVNNDQALAWSFKALALGVHPRDNHVGTPFTPLLDPLRHSLIGDRIAGPNLTALFEYRGDLKQLAEGLGVPHYGSVHQP